MKLEIAIHTHNYEKRLCWMLSSILQQEGNVPDITVSIAYLPGTDKPACEDVIAFFRDKGLDIIEVIMKENEIHNRSISRNIRAGETEADWILFADSDMVYDSHFFEDIQKKLDTDERRNETKVFGANRHSLDIPFCIKYFDEDEREYPCEIPNVASICSEWPVMWVKGAGIAPGNFQLARVQAIKDKGGIYCGTKRDLWRRTKSDRGFRVHMGGRIPMETLHQYHLNHDRGGPELQR